MDDKHLQIMVVEDEITLLKAIGIKLKRKNIDSLLYSGGTAAFDYLEKTPVMPQAIWLDYYLQDMDGIGFMQRLRGNPKFEKIPVFIVSNSASSDKVKGLLALGAKKYFLKAENSLEDIINDIYRVL